MNKKVKLCILIVLLLALLGIGSALAIHFLGAHSRVAEVYQDGELIKTIDLNTVTAPYEFTVNGEGGAYNVIRVEPGKIAITEASCPDKVCVHTGYISDSLMPITCLPNHVIIRIRPGDTPGESGAIDGFSH